MPLIDSARSAGDHPRMPGQRFVVGGSIRRSVAPASALAAIWLALLAAAPPAKAADTMSLSSSPANPTGVTPLKITATVGSTTTAGSNLTVIVNPRGQACPADPSTDSNAKVISQTASGGAETIGSNPEAFEHGGYRLCGWLVDATNGTTTAQLPITIANPDKLSLRVSPLTVTDGADSTVSLTGIADVHRPAVFITRKSAGTGGCAANPSADRGALIPGYDPAATFGAFSSSSSVALGTGPSGRSDQEPPGAYVLCAWLMDAAGSKTVPLAPAQSASVTLTAPTGTLAYSLPELIEARKRFSLQMSFTTSAADITLFVDLKPLPAHGRPCASSAAADRGVVKTFSSSTPSARTTVPVTLSRPGVYVACAWLEWPHGTIDGPFPGRFVVASSHQHAITYYGTTSQHLPRSKLRSSYPIVFQTIDGQIVNLAYFARFTCTRTGRPSSRPIYTTSFPAFGLSSATHFGDTFVQGTDRAVVDGGLTSRRATGTLNEMYTSAGYTCRSGTVRFSARRG
jgi:hypothetical protein